MRTIKIEVEDADLQKLLVALENLKGSVIRNYEVTHHDTEQDDIIAASQEALSTIWDNEEDSVYDRFLKV